jgi:SAM-dependent methyltransferase
MANATMNAGFPGEARFKSVQLAGEPPRQVADSAATVSDVSSVVCHQNQYDDSAARFFKDFNSRTGRDTLFWGYMEGHLSNNKDLIHDESVAVDLGCGTGWLVPNLALNFQEVYGIDTSASMLRVALAKRNGERIKYYQKAPEHILGKCDFVSAIHVHYHFDTIEKLKREFFRVAADLLKPDGEFLLIGCPSDYLRDTPEHYKNHISTNDIPDGILKQMSQISLLTDTADTTGFVPLSTLPKSYKDGTPFNLVDGTQMKVVFNTTDNSGKVQTLSLTDTFWSDKTLIRTAEECGLALEKRKDMTWRDHPNAYMALHFRKLSSPRL